MMLTTLELGSSVGEISFWNDLLGLLIRKKVLLIRKKVCWFEPNPSSRNIVISKNPSIISVAGRNSKCCKSSHCMSESFACFIFNFQPHFGRHWKFIKNQRWTPTIATAVAVVSTSKNETSFSVTRSQKPSKRNLCLGLPKKFPKP